ncbi:hypothetical protein F52700_1474 [Fusarium sp. NRRL 52700]|nr:hypothetical protein F52700_1474 [Fusarium sp. NRRL 52700]
MSGYPNDDLCPNDENQNQLGNPGQYGQQNNISGYPNYAMPPEGENQNQTGNRGQNPGQYEQQNNISGYPYFSLSSNYGDQNQTGNQGQNLGQYPHQNNLRQGSQLNQTLIDTTPVGPGQSYLGQNPGPMPWEPQPPIPLVQHGNWNPPTQLIPDISHQILNYIFNLLHPIPHDPQALTRSWTWVLRGLQNMQQTYQESLASGSFNHDGCLDASNLFSFANPGSAGFGLNNTGNIDDLGVGPAPIQSQREPHPAAGHPIVVNAHHDHSINHPAPPNPQPSLGGPSTGGRRKRARAASPNTTAPAPKRTRNLPPDASGEEGDNDNSSGNPGPAPNTTLLPPREAQRTRKRKADIDEEEVDDEDDVASDLRPQKRSRGESPDSKQKSNSRKNLKKEDKEWVVPGTICDFCSKHPDILDASPCDWEQVPNRNGPEVYNVECTNCANHRSRNKDHTQLDQEDDHKCYVPGPQTSLIHFEYKRYGDSDPRTCRHHKAKCDPVNWAKPGCIDRTRLTNRANKETYTPGPLYYLALGYGSGGVNDFKDGQRLEHWVGPAAPLYGLTEPKQGPQRYQYVARAHENHRPPAGVVPPGIPSDKLLSKMNAQELGNLIAMGWPGSAQPPRSNLEGYKKVWALLRGDQQNRMSLLGEEPESSGQRSTVRSFQGGPILEDIERLQSRIPPVGDEHQQATQSRGFSQILPTPMSSQYGDAYNLQQNAPTPQAQPYQHQAVHRPGSFTDFLNQPYEGPAAVRQEEDGGFNPQQPQPMWPSADQQIHNSSGHQTLSHMPEELQVSQDQCQPNQQDFENLDQQSLDPHSQQMVSRQGRADPEQDRQLINSNDWLEMLAPLRASSEQNPVDENGERRPFANSAILAPDTENGYQQPHSGPRAPDQSPERSTEFQKDSDWEFEDWVDLEGTQALRRSRASRGERWHEPRISRDSKKSSQQRTARGNRPPKNANDQDAFNPFLGFTFGPDQKPQFMEKPKSSRWKVFNHLEGIDMSEWHESKYKEPEEESQPRLFSIVNRQTNQPTPLRDVLGDVPYEQKDKRTRRYCAEPGEGGWGACRKKGQTICQSSAHRNTVPPYFPVCNDCTWGNVKYLFQHEHNPITEGELLSMRAYLCNDCAGQMGSGAPNAAQNQVVGTRRVYGIAADEAHSQNIQKLGNGVAQAANLKRNTEALTGCSCANRILGTSLCRFHRLYYAEEAMKHAALMQEWRLSRFKKAVCPSCLAQKPNEQVNVSANVDGFVRGAPTAWACVVCNDWVVNEKNDVNNQPKAIDKPLWNLNIGRKLLDPRREMTTGRVLGELVSV